jgi:hypothetical protein
MQPRTRALLELTTSMKMLRTPRPVSCVLLGNIAKDMEESFPMETVLRDGSALGELCTANPLFLVSVSFTYMFLSPFLSYSGNFTHIDVCSCPEYNYTGGKCQPGTFCPSGSAAPVDCTPGSYCGVYELSEPTGGLQVTVLVTFHSLIILILQGSAILDTTVQLVNTSLTLLSSCVWQATTAWRDQPLRLHVQMERTVTPLGTRSWITALSVLLATTAPAQLSFRSLAYVTLASIVPEARTLHPPLSILVPKASIVQLEQRSL